MKKFDNVYEALKEVKRLSKIMILDSLTEIYFVYNEFYEDYLVSTDENKISEAIHQIWADSGCDNKPEDEAREYKIWVYSSAENKRNYPNTYKNAKKALFSSDIPLVRTKKEVKCEYCVDFLIND